MSIRRLFFFLLSAIVFLAMAGIQTEIQGKKGKKDKETIITGRNVNMVSGTILPDGDPWLQRQNEPSIAVSTLNPLHLLAAGNDYRTVDIPLTEGELSGFPEGGAQGDAWLGVFKSFDGGESWKSTLLPGYPQDTGSTSPLHGYYNAAADPVVRAGTDGLFYLSGIAFKRENKVIGESAVFVSRYRDNNDQESGDTIGYEGTEIVDLGNLLQFTDKPWIAVDIPRNGDCGNVYIVYTVFSGSDMENMTSEIRFARSEDCGSNWSTPVPIASASALGYFGIAKKEKKGLFQGATIAIDPRDGTIYVAWRKFNMDIKKDAIYIAKSDDSGGSFSSPIQVTNKIKPFDQGTSGATFRTNSYPTIAIDEGGRVYLAWSERHGKTRSSIMLATSENGKKWSSATAVDHKGRGHQFMPSLTYAAGKLMVAWYDQREDFSQRFTEYLDDRTEEPRHTIDVRVAQADPGKHPKFGPSVQVSRYLYVLTEDGTSLYQGQFNPLNFPLFKGGTAPFHGDYIDISPSPMFVWDELYGEWRFNTEPTDSPPVFHVAWTDNRDVIPPQFAPYDWTLYTPVDVAGNDDYESPPDIRPDCGGGHKPGMRNQNIYTSRISQGLKVGSPRNSKDLSIFQRSFVVFVNNTTAEEKSFRLTIPNQPTWGQASFHQFEDIIELDVSVAPHSSIARPVFVESSDADDSVRIEVTEIDMPGGDPISGGLSSFVDLNPGEAPSQLEDPEESIPVVQLTEIIDWSNPPLNEPLNPNIFNPNIFNPNIFNPNIFNTNVVNPNIFNPNIFNPNIFNPNIFNPNIFNPNIFNPNIFNPNIFNASLEGSDIVDVVWTARNEGNTTSSYTFKTFAKDSLPAGIYTQLLIYKTHKTPTTDYNPDETGTGCESGEEQHDELLANIINPNIFNPNIFNPNIFNPNIFNASIENATFSVAPGEEVNIMLRLVKPPAEQSTMMVRAQLDGFDLINFAEGLGASTTGMIVDTVDAEQGIETPPASATQLIIGTGALPDGTVDLLYGDPLKNYDDATLKAAGGTGSYLWSIISGELPPGLSLNHESVPGRIGGLPTTAGTYHFFVRVYSGDETDTQQYSIIIIDPDTGPGPLIITTESLPSGIQGTYYGATLEAEGGVSPRTWDLASGDLPKDLTLYENGLISGRLTDVVDTYSFTVRVTDNDGATDTMPLSIVVSESTGVDVTISGSVEVEGGEGPPVAGVLMHGLPGAPTTDEHGFYSDLVPQGWTGTVTPLLAGHTFDPASWTHTNVISNETKDYTAIPIAVLTLTTQVNPDGAGSIIKFPDEPVYVPLTDVQLTATANPGHTFSHWSGDASGTDNPIIINLDANKNITGNFTLDEGWAATYNGPGSKLDRANAMTSDSLGNIYVTGFSTKAGTGGDCLTIKYDDSLYEQWVARYAGGGNSTDNGIAIAVDDSGVYVLAYSRQSENDHSEATDYVTIKYDSNLDQQWVARYEYGEQDIPSAIAVDSTRVYVTGYSDTDPGPTVTNLDYATVAYDKSTGVPLWTARYDGGNGDDVAWDIAVDDSGVYVTGYSYGEGTGIDYATIGYDKSTGTPLWTTVHGSEGAARYNGPGGGRDRATSIAVDSSGVYVTGYSYGGTSQDDFATIAYDKSNGNLLWGGAVRYDGGYDDVAWDIAVDDSGVYVTGYSDGGGTGFDYATIGYDKSGGDLLWETDSNPEGATRYDGGSGNDFANAIAVDPSGVYVTGESYGGDPEQGGTGFDYVTVRYDKDDGGTLWEGVARYDGGSGYDSALDIVCSNNEVYVTGSSYGGTGTTDDFTTIRYDSLGVEGPVAPYNGPGNNNDEAVAIAVDSSGVYVTGRSAGSEYNRGPGYDTATVKFEESGGIGVKVWDARHDVTSFWNHYPTDMAVDLEGNTYVTGYGFTTEVTWDDFFTIKYNSLGEVVWVATYDNGGSDRARAIAVDSTGVYVTGSSHHDSEAGSNADYATIRYNKDTGALLWTEVHGPNGDARYNGPEDGSDYAVDIALNANHVYVTGASVGAGQTPDYVTIQYAKSNGVPVWTTPANYDHGDSDFPKAIAVDASGNVYVTGESYDVEGGDFPGFDYATVMYDNSGTQQWASRYEQPYHDTPFAIAVDSATGDVYVTGQSDTSDDPDPLSDYTTIKYDASGVEQWVARYDGPANEQDVAYDIALDSDGNIYVTGESDGVGTSFDCATLQYNSSGDLMWVERYNGSANFDDVGRAIAVYEDAFYIYIYVAGFSHGTGTDRDYLVLLYKLPKPVG